MFEFTFNDTELDALNTLVSSNQQNDSTPVWVYMGQNVWDMNFDDEGFEGTFAWAIETVDVA